MDGINIFIADDDKDIVNLLGDILEDEGYKVTKAYNGLDAFNILKKDEFSLIILDIMMPGMDGLEICRKIRDIVDTPIIFLTAKDKSIDKIVGLEIGADDYITKPFDDNEIIARVKAHLRRQRRNGLKDTALKEDGVIEYKNIKININSYEVFVDEEKVDLSTREFQILSYFMKNPNIVLTRDKIYNSVWGFEDYGDINTVTVHIKKLREKIKDADRFIKTVWGVGYKFIGDK